jgi:hypothetical protein
MLSLTFTSFPRTGVIAEAEADVSLFLEQPMAAELTATMAVTAAR